LRTKDDSHGTDFGVEYHQKIRVNLGVTAQRSLGLSPTPVFEYKNYVCVAQVWLAKRNIRARGNINVFDELRGVWARSPGNQHGKKMKRKSRRETSLEKL